MFQSFCDTDRSYGLHSKVGHGSTGSSPSGSPCLPCVHEGRRRRPYPVTGGGCQDPQLPRRLAYPSPIQRAVGRSQGLGAPAPQPVGASGQLGKKQALPCAENLYSRCGVRLRSCSHTARIASYETTSALATLPGPEVGMAPRYTASGYHPAVSPLPQPLDGPCLSTGRGAPRTSVGKHDLIVRFLKGARWMNPSRPPHVPSWDLSIVLAGLQRGPFEPLDSVELKFLSLKTALLTALTSIKGVRDLQAFSVSEECLVFGPVYSHVVLRLRPGYVPKVPTTPFRDQVVNLQALPSKEADPALALLCPVRALRIYVDRTRSVRSSKQLFVCHGGQQKGKAVSKQRLAHWIVEAVALAYQSQGEPCPLGVRAHSTRSVASSHALVHGASLADICRAAGWATPNTFARFYNLRVEPVSSRVLGK